MNSPARYPESISKEQLAELPVASFPGAAVVVDTPEAVAPALEALEAARCIGFDTETRPSFRKGVMFPVALLQLATPTQCFLFRLNIIGMPPRLREFLESKDFTKIGLSVKDDFNAMRRLVPSLRPDGFVELQELARRNGINESSLKKIYAIIFGCRISKGQRLTNWEAPKLTPSQCAYAALDAWACLRIYNSLSHS